MQAFATRLSRDLINDKVFYHLYQGYLVTTAERTEGAARAEASLRALCRVATEEHGVNVRQRRKWFSRKYYAWVMRLKEFYEDNVGRSFTGIISNALNKNSTKISGIAANIARIVVHL